MISVHWRGKKEGDWQRGGDNEREGEGARDTTERKGRRRWHFLKLNFSRRRGDGRVIPSSLAWNNK